MKKMLGFMMVAMVWMALAMPASAVENEFGGYWRTRGISMQDFNMQIKDKPPFNKKGTDSYVDTRTRLFYTAKFSDKFKFVNKFEFDQVWGDTVGGDLGTDGKGILEVKNSYADFSVANHNFKVGMQPGKIGRGFLFDDDFAGLIATCSFDKITLPFYFMKVSDEKLLANAATTEREYYAVSPVFNLSSTLSLNPYLLFDKEEGTDTTVYYLGADVNAKVDAITAWGTAIFQTGESNDLDTTAFLLGAGADAGLVHGQFFYASGDDDASDDEQNAFGLHFPVGSYKGQTYYWSEIMGEGVFDGTRSNNSPGLKITDIMAANIGCTVKPMDKLTLSGDLWYAQLAEERLVNGSMEDVLGLEIDLKATYMVLDNLKLDVVAAYLIAGDATGEDDPIEIGTQLSFSF